MKFKELSKRNKILILMSLVLVLTTILICVFSIKPKDEEKEVHLLDTVEESIESNSEQILSNGNDVIDENNLEKEGFLESNPEFIAGDTENEEKFVVGARQSSPVYFSQIDSRWSNHPYTSVGNPSQTIGSSGCGPTSAAMIVSSIKGTIYPNEMGDLYVNHGFRTPSDGTYLSAFKWTADYFGIEYETVNSTFSMADMVGNGYYTVVSCNSGLFTTGGHFIVVYGREEDMLKIYDPYLYNGKFDSYNRAGKVTVSGNTVYCSISNFKAYANAQAFFCFKHDGEIPEPSPTPTPEPSQSISEGVVKVNTSLNIRNGAGTNYSIVGSLSNGSVVNIYETLGNWYRIGDNEWVCSDYVRTGTDTSRNTVGNTFRLNTLCDLWSNSNLSGIRYTYKANTTVRVLENISDTVDKVYIPATGRTAYINITYYGNSAGGNSYNRGTVGQTRYFKKTWTYIYSNPSLTGTPYTYYAGTKVTIQENTTSGVDKIYCPKTGRVGYVSTSVYK